MFEELLDKCQENGWTVTYMTMKNGKRGHFITLGFCWSPYDSFHTYVESSEEDRLTTLQKAIELAEEKLKEKRY